VARAPRGPAILLWAVAPIVCFLQFYRPADVGGSRAAAIPVAVGAWRRERTHELTERTYALLGTRDVLWANYADASGDVVTLTAVFHAENWKSVHPPDVCIMGSGYVIESSAVEQVRVAGDGEVEVGTIAASGDGGRLWSFYVFGTRGFTTPSYLSFFLHHVPAALLRSATEGFLLRVECLERGGGASAARERCARFMGEVLPVVQEAMQ
jgi:EpsI family protein